MKFLKWLFRTFFILLFTVAALVTFVVSTESGLNMLLVVADKVIPGNFEYDRIEGRLAGPLILEGIHYSDAGGLDFQLREGLFDWRPRQLLSARLGITTLKLEGITLRLPEPAIEEEPPGEPFSLPDIQLPLAIDIDEFSVSDIHLFPYGSDQPFIVDDIRLQAQTVDDTVELETLEVALPDARVKLAGDVTPVGAYPLALNLSWSLQNPQLGNLQGQGTLSGELAQTLTLEHQSGGSVETTLNGSFGNLFTQPSWDADLAMATPDLGLFVPDLQGSDLTGRIQSQGTLDDFQLSGNINTTVPELGPVELILAAGGSQRALKISRLDLKAAQAPLSFSANADIDLERQIVSAAGRWQDLSWPLTGPAQVSSPRGQFTLDGTIKDYQLDLSTRVSGAQFGDLDIVIAADGSDERVQLNSLNVRSPDHEELTLDINGQVVLADLMIEATGSWENLSWPLNAPAQIVVPQGQLNISGTPKAYRLELNTTVDGPQLIPLNALVEASGTDKSLTVSNISVQSSEQDLRFDAKADVGFENLDFNATGQWQQLAWPLQGDPQFESSEGNLTASGNLEEYVFALNATIQGKDIPQGVWVLNGQGSDKAMQELTITGTTLDGALEGTVAATWQPTVSWQMALSGDSLNPGAKWPDIAGNLNFKLETEGSLGAALDIDENRYSDEVFESSPQALNARVQLIDLSGTLRDQPVQGQAQITLNNQDIDIQSLQLEAGNAKLQATGTVADTLNLSWNLQVPALGRLLPDAQGSISGSGVVQGTRAEPKADIELKLSDLAYQENKIQSLQGKASVDLTGATASSADFRASGMQLAGQNWQSLNLTGKGTPAQHQATLSLQGDLGNFALALAGGLENQIWQGSIRELTAQNTLAGDWALAGQLPLTLSPQRIVAERGCLRSNPSELCLQGEWSSENGGNATVALQNLDFSRFKEFLPPDLTINNSLSGEAKANLAADGSVAADADFKISAGAIRMVAQGQQVEINLQESFLRGQSNGRDAGAQFGFDLGSLGQAQGELKLADLAGKKEVDGSIKANIDDLKLVSTFVPQIQDIEGQLTADLTLGGALPVPAIRGAIRLQNAGLEVPEAGIQITDIAFAVTGDGNGPLQISGSAQSGPGSVNLDGTVEPFTRQLSLSIKGDQFQAMNSPEIQAVVSPDLQIELDQNQVRVDGRVTIPSAYISPPGGSSGVSGVGVSNDVVIITDPDEEITDTQSGMAIFAKVQVILGDDVNVEAAGFKGQLQGELTVEQTPQLAPRGSGTIQVAAGDYKIYGQDLAIERGRVLFSGGPIDNPGLDLRVSRSYDENGENITVGAQIGGTLQSPDLELFSQPAMPDSSIVSYLIFGRAPDTSSETENALLYQAATALATTGGSSTIKNVSDKLGLDDLSFEGGQSLDEASLVIGKYLSPDLYISFGIGLFDAAETFNLRYKITDRLSFESSTSGEQSGADVTYTVEW